MFPQIGVGVAGLSQQGFVIKESAPAPEVVVLLPTFNITGFPPQFIIVGEPSEIVGLEIGGLKF